MDSKGHIYCGTDKATHSNQGTGGVPLGTATSHQVGPGNKQLDKKREWAVWQDEKMRRERHSQWIRKIEGVNTLRKGMIKIG